jgi:hypothetical protein
MHIEISVAQSHPPSGVVIVDGGDRQLFSGWLGLLHILTVALDPQTPPSGVEMRRALRSR